jgi:hypothetical protein
MKMQWLLCTDDKSRDKMEGQNTTGGAAHTIVMDFIDRADCYCIQERASM